MELKQGSYTRTEGAAPKDNAMVMFYIDAVADRQASAQAGRLICTEKEMIEIRFPGNQHSVWNLEVKDEHREKYAKAYDAFKRGEEVTHEGTPIESLTVLSRAQVKELKYLSIHTVEAAASMSDTATQQFMGGYKLRELAKRYLEDAQGLAPLSKMVEENDNLKARVETQERQIAELNQMMVGMKAQLDIYAVAPRPPEYVAPGAFGGLPQSAPLPAPPPVAVARSSLDSIGEPVPKRRGRPPGKVAA